MNYLAALRSDPCAYCGEAGATIDHIEPRVGNGANDWTNLTSACRSCNSRKGHRPLLLSLLTDAPRPRSAATVWLSGIVGANVRAARGARGLTQADVGRAVGAGLALVSHWERGVTMPSDRNKERLAVALGCTVADFYAGADTGDFRASQEKAAA